MQVCIVVLADNQMKLLNYVKDDLKSWISVNESVSREQIKLFITPERTFPGSSLQIKIPEIRPI